MILITGATGFLGRNLLPRLRDAGYPVRALVRPHSDTAFLRQEGVELALAADISDTAAVADAMQGCSHVIHAAGLFRFWGDRASFWQTNVGGTAAVLQAAADAGIERFIHISTIAVVGRTPERGVITEKTPCRPQEHYQNSKLEAERLALTYHRERGLPVIVLRPGAFYGPWGRYAFNRLFFEEPLKGWRIKVDGGRHITFPVFVPDVAEAILLALQKGQPGEIYNICGQSLDHNSVNAIVSDLSRIGHWRMNVPTSAVLLLARAWTALSRFTRQEPFYPINMAPYVFQDWHVSYAKAEAELGFTPTPFAVGARHTLHWYWQQGLLRRSQ
jgi:dihydroflavonol-4-reductase